MRIMKRKRPKGVTIFGVIYNMLGLIGLSACFYGLNTIAHAQPLIIGNADYAQMMVITATVLFFASSFLIVSYKKVGYLLTIFLLTFFIAGGFVVLLPLLIAHIIYFLSPKIHKKFT